MDHDLTPDLVLRAYASGIFPMSESQDDEDIFWVDPEQRGVIPLDGFHISRSLAKTIKSTSFTIRFNTDFVGVVEGCANRNVTWINGTIFSLYKDLHEMGFAHSVEVWENDTQLVGGAYGVAINGAFFGESMFSRRPNASKIALAFLVDRLLTSGFTLLDTQFITPHLATMGAVEIPRDMYREQLARALETPAAFDGEASAPSGQSVLQRNAQTS